MTTLRRNDLDSGKKRLDLLNGRGGVDGEGGSSNNGPLDGIALVKIGTRIALPR